MGHGDENPRATGHASGETAVASERRWPIVAREGWPIVLGFVVVAGALAGVARWLLGPAGAWAAGSIGFVLCAWCVWFFRDPTRAVPQDPDAIVCPADGVVCAIDEAPPPPELDLGARGIGGGEASRMLRVCVFMNVFNVHVNRSPVSGVVVADHYRPGAFLNASLDKASERNERRSLAVRMDDGRVVVAVQIAGLVARRIVSRARVGDRLRAGDRFGLIRFGSRVDVHAPPGSIARVRVGERVHAGETILASLPVGTPDARRADAGRVGAGV